MLFAFTIALFSACDDGSKESGMVVTFPGNGGIRDIGNDQPMQNECGSFDGPGLYAVGIREVTLNGTPLSVWYPTAPSNVTGLEKATYDMRAWLPEATANQIPDSAAPIHSMDAYWDVPVADGVFQRLAFIAELIDECD